MDETYQEVVIGKEVLRASCDAFKPRHPNGK